MAELARTHKRTRDTAFGPKSNKALFNNSSFSDLTIELRDGDKIPCHKAVLCPNNEYFEKMCGAGSPWAEREATHLKLDKDDPDAVRAVIRHIYGYETEGFGQEPRHPWQYWDSLIQVADYYAQPDLSTTAQSRLRTHACAFGQQGDVNGLCNVLDALRKHDAITSMEDYASILVDQFSHLIVGNVRFTSYLIKSPKIMLEVVQSRDVARKCDKAEARGFCRILDATNELDHDRDVENVLLQMAKMCQGHISRDKHLRSRLLKRPALLLRLVVCKCGSRCSLEKKCLGHRDRNDVVEAIDNSNAFYEDEAANVGADFLRALTQVHRNPGVGF